MEWESDGPGGLAERVREAVPPKDLPRKRRMRARKRGSCWRCPILAETDTINGNTLEVLTCVLGNIRALAHECKKRHDKREGR
jgi:hypothetical protein